jgi:hypothetical protein
MAPHESIASSCVRQLFDAVRRRSADLADDLHPAVLEQGLTRLGLPTGPVVTGSPKCAAALAALYRLQWPSLDRFEAKAHRVALLARQDMLRVLAAVALHSDRGRVRLSIGPGLRALLVERVGENAYRTLLESPSLRMAPVRPFSAAELDADRLAWRGLETLVSIGAWKSRRLLQRVRLAFEPSHAQTVLRIAGTRAQPEVLERLSSYFPEHAWLFGSPMDRALSASTTA